MKEKIPPPHRYTGRGNENASQRLLSRSDEKEKPLHKRDQVARMTVNDWCALSKDERSDLVRRAQCDLLGSFRHCADRRCRRARWCASSDPRACKDKLWKLKRVAPKTLRKAVAKLEDIIYWRT